MFLKYFSIIFALIGCCSLTCAKGFSCEEGWSKLGINCFKVFTFYGSYGAENFANSKDAKSRCEALGANLASLHSSFENQFVQELVRKSYAQCQKDNVPWCCDSYTYDGYWIGMSLTRASNGTILSAKWSDGTNTHYGNPLKFADRTPWYTPEHRPKQDNSESNCVFMLLTNSDIGWADYDCAMAKIGGYVCKKKAKKDATLQEIF
ncbi:hypothetical protein niasHS_011501 [Heterodera schachtii]|uniref:C-type lectin domain-containing protein n=1 Tax=Heterodera schachtii TaxID=97005 RepID=A0ABD2I9I2_HETSC